MNETPFKASNTVSRLPKFKHCFMEEHSSSCEGVVSSQPLKNKSLCHHFMSVDFHIGVPLRRGAPGLESSLLNEKRDISE